MSLVDDFKDTLASWASGVSVVTANEGGLLYGLTVSSFTSLSLEPPLVLVCLNNSNRLPEMIEGSRGFGVSILDRDQEAASNHFASRGREPSAEILEVEMERTAAGIPVVSGALAWLECRLHDTILQGDHTIIVGEVTEARASGGEAPPLLYFRRGYRGVDPA